MYVVTLPRNTFELNSYFSLLFCCSSCMLDYVLFLFFLLIFILVRKNI